MSGHYIGGNMTLKEHKKNVDNMIQQGHGDKEIVLYEGILGIYYPAKGISIIKVETNSPDGWHISAAGEEKITIE